MSEQHDAGALILNSAHWTHGVDHGEQEVVSRCLPQLCDTSKSHPRRRKRKTSTPSHSFCSLWIREQTLVLCASNRERCRWERHDLQRIQETTKVTEDESEAFRPTHGVHRDVGVFSCPHTLQPSHVWNDTWRSATHSVSACVRVVLSKGGREGGEKRNPYTTTGLIISVCGATVDFKEGVMWYLACSPSQIMQCLRGWTMLPIMKHLIQYVQSSVRICICTHHPHINFSDQLHGSYCIAGNFLRDANFSIFLQVKTNSQKFKNLLSQKFLCTRKIYSYLSSLSTAHSQKNIWKKFVLTRIS